MASVKSWSSLPGGGDCKLKNISIKIKSTDFEVRQIWKAELCYVTLG